MNQTIIVLFFSIVGFYVFLNLGNFLDVTKKPIESDIIVALGGDDYSGCRLKKAVSMYKEGFSKSKIFIYTGLDSLKTNFKELNNKKNYLLKENIKKENIFYISSKVAKNTMEEIFFIKKYMLYNNYKSVIFVSHPYHSRRIITLANLIAGYEAADLKLSVVSCNPVLWNKSKYYTNKTSLLITLKESVKFTYNLMKYSFLLIKYTNYYKYHKDMRWNNILEKKDTSSAKT